MTLTQSLKLCQRRRPMVDPIPAFLHQLASYERECRTLGYLTAVDDVLINNDSVAEAYVGTGGQKRKAKSSDSDDDMKKKAIVGPAIGPSTLLKGPGRSAVIGPARGPPTKENNC
jgi:hypothetical protein